MTAALCAGGNGVWALDGSSACLSSVDPESQLDRLPDCMRMGRHVRVGTSVSHGTATLDDGMMHTTLRGSDGQNPPRRRIYVPTEAGRSLWSDFFGRR